MAVKNKPEKPVAQYLARHAEPEAALAGKVSGDFGHVLVIPSYGERETLFAVLGSVPGGPAGPVLQVVVLNARSDSPKAVHDANESVRQRLARDLPSRVSLSDDPPITAHAMPAGTLLLIDRALQGHFLPEKQGVGLARKIGNDAALALHTRGRIASPWIWNTDADVLLPRDYFDQMAEIDPSVVCGVYSFEHRLEADPALAEAARLYEISLRYYVLGLAWAGSPYAYESMGSCFAISPEAYAKVRGFPKKNAAEDFYILDKLAKVGPVARLNGTPIQLEGRLSDRVPFGTGRALTDMTGSKRGVEGFRLYHPLVFGHLAAWIRVMEAIAKSGSEFDKPLLPSGTPFLKADLMQEALSQLGAFEAVREAIGRSHDEATLLRHLHTWFDAFRTLRFVHLLRDGGLRSLAWRQALAEAPFTNLSGSTEEDTEVLRQALAEEERKLAGTNVGVTEERPAAET
ncbi:MAG TPA: hypothetical protein VF376_03935 [Thermoanaerobaculia bacterium]